MTEVVSLSVRTAVVWEHSSVAGGEVEGARLAVADENGSAGGALVEVEPFLSLSWSQLSVCILVKDFDLRSGASAARADP